MCFVKLLIHEWPILLSKSTLRWSLWYQLFSKRWVNTGSRLVSSIVISSGDNKQTELTQKSVLLGENVTFKRPFFFIFNSAWLPLLHRLSGSRSDGSTPFDALRLIRIHCCFVVESKPLIWFDFLSLHIRSLAFQSRQYVIWLWASNGITRSWSGFAISVLVRCLKRWDCVHCCVLLAICLAQYITPEQPINNGAATSNSGVMLTILASPYTNQ